MVIKNKKLDPRVAALKPQKLNAFYQNTAGRAGPGSSYTQKIPNQFYPNRGDEIIDVSSHSEDVIDLGAPRSARRKSFYDEPAPRRRRVPYVPNPRLYPGPKLKPKHKSRGSEGRGAGHGRRQRRSYRWPLPNSRLYRPAPPRPPPPALQPVATWPPPPPPRQLQTASHVALTLQEQRAGILSRRHPPSTPGRRPPSPQHRRPQSPSHRRPQSPSHRHLPLPPRRPSPLPRHNPAAHRNSPARRNPPLRRSPLLQRSPTSRDSPPALSHTSSPRRLPVPASSQLTASSSRRLVVTVPGAAGGDSSSASQPYRPTSAHFRQCVASESRATDSPAELRPISAMDAGRHSASPEDRSEAESHSAPSEFLAEFLSAIMQRQYAEALKYCRLILQYEPQNATARSFYPLLRHKVSSRRRAESASRGSSDEVSAGEAAAGAEPEAEAEARGSSPDEPDEALEEDSAPSLDSQSSLELDSSELLHSSSSVSLSRRTDHTDRSDSASGGCWDSPGSGSRSEADDNGNAPTHATAKPIQPGDLENDNAAGEPAITKNDSMTSLRRLRAQFACSIK